MVHFSALLIYRNLFLIMPVVGIQLYLALMFPWRENNWVLEHIIKLAGGLLKCRLKNASLDRKDTTSC